MKLETKLDLIKLLGTSVVSEMTRLSEEGIEVGVECLRFALFWAPEHHAERIYGVYFCDDPGPGFLELPDKIISPRFGPPNEKTHQRTLLVGMDKPIWIDKDLLTCTSKK